MTASSHDPKISEILQLVSLLTGYPWVETEKTAQGVGNDLDGIIAKLKTLVEKPEKAGRRLHAAQDITGQQPPWQMFQYSVDQATDAIFWLTHDASFAYVNEQACRSLGYSREELLQLKWWDIAPAYASEQWHLSWEQWREDRRDGGERLETVHHRKDNSIFPVEVSSTHLWFGDQELHIATCRDITQRKQMEEELREHIAQHEHTKEILKENQTTLQAALESMQDGLLVITQDGAVSHYNSSFCQMWSIPEKLMPAAKDRILIDYVLPQLVEPKQFTTRVEEVYQTSDPSEDILQLKDGRLFERMSYPLIREYHETGRVWLFRDITEKRRAEEALQESEHLLSVSQAVAHLGSYYFDVRLGTWVNSPALDDIFGITDDYPKNIEGWTMLVHPDDREGMLSHLTDHVLKKHQPFKKEYRIIRHNDQQERWVLGLGELEFDEHGSPIKMIGTIQDITERKRAEIGRQESEHKFRAVVQNAQAIIFILDSDGIFTLSEGQDLNKIGLVPNQVVGTSALELYGDNPAVLEGIKKALAGELVHAMSEVQGIIFDVVYSPFYNLKNELDGVVGIAIDITERRRSELELQKQKRFIDAILENSPIGFAINAIDDGRVMFASNRFGEIYGHVFETIDNVDRFFEKVYPDPVFRKQIRERIVTDIASGDPSRMRWENIPITTDTGERRVITATNIPLWEQNLMISTVQDVTERAHAEEKLRLNGFALERMTDGFYWVDRDTRIVDVNEAACRMLGYSRDELVGMMLEDINPTFDYSNKDAIWEGIKKDPLPPLESQHMAKDGTLIPVEILANYIEFEGKELSCTFTRDITERKQTEEALRQSEARYRALVESQVDMVSRYLPDTTLTFVNDAYCQFFGKTHDELIGQSYLIMVAPEFRELTLEETKDIARNPRLLSGEYLNYAADGREHWIHWIIQPILNEQGQVTELQAVGRDITQIKQTEEALRESEFFLQKSQEVARIGSYQLDISAGTWICSPTLDKIYGIDDSFTRDVEGWLTLIHPEQREEMRQYLHQHISTKNNRFDKKFRIRRHGDQQEVWVHGLGELEYDENETPIVAIGTVQDITAQKLAEEALRLANFAVETISDAVYWIDNDATIINVNEAACRMVGYSREEFAGMSVSELDPIMPLNEIKSLWDQTKEKGTLKFETHHITKNGHVFPVEILASHISYERRSLSCCFVRDITERKQAEEAIHELNEELEQRVIERTQELEQANEEIKHFAYIVSHDLRAPLVNLKGFAAELRADLKVVEEHTSNVLPLIDSDQRDKLTHILQEDIPESLRFIESSVSNMDMFTKAILRLSRLGRLHLDLVEVRVGPLVEKILESLSYQITQQGIRVTVGDLPVITADLVSIEQIFANILTNAVTYLDPDRAGEIDISAEHSIDDIIFHIRDNGQGIDPEDADKVFAPFRRAGRQDMPGEGMGLAYVQTLVRRHGGRIWFQSEPGKGTTFSFTIPIDLNNTVEM